MHRLELYVNSQSFPSNIHHFFVQCIDEDTKFQMVHALSATNVKMMIFFTVSIVTEALSHVEIIISLSEAGNNMQHDNSFPFKFTEERYVSESHKTI